MSWQDSGHEGLFQGGVGEHLGLQVRAGANGGKGALDRHALAARLTLPGRLAVLGAPNAQAYCHEVVGGNVAVQGPQQPPGRNQVCALGDAQSFQHLFIDLHNPDSMGVNAEALSIVPQPEPA